MHIGSYTIKSDNMISDLNMYYLEQARSANCQSEGTFLKMYDGRTVKCSKDIQSEMQEEEDNSI
jgi:hypothetical protein